MRYALIFSILLLTISCEKKLNSEFSLRGISESLENGELIFLIDSSTKTILDSVEVKNENFYFQSELPSFPFRAILRNKDNSYNVSLWLENKAMTIKTRGEDSENFIVSGSETENKYDNLYKALDTLSKKEGQELLINFIKNNSDNILGPFVLSDWYISLKKDKTESLYRVFTEEAKSSIYGKEILNYVQNYRNPGLGEKYVDFGLPNQYGELRKPSGFKSNLILLEFWASWCGPCRSDNKIHRQLYEEYRFSGFDIFQVSLDTEKDDWLKAIEKDSLVWTNVSDLKGWKSAPALIYGVNMLPCNYLIDKNGIIVGRNLRGEELETRIKECLYYDGNIFKQ